jgi:phosphoserine phosphatase
MDGTLTMVPSSAFLGRVLGYAEEAEERERRYAAGVMTNQDVAIGDAVHFRGRSIREVWTILEDLPRVAGIRETVDQLHERGMAVLITTVAWTFVAEYFQDRYGFDASSGCVMRVDADGRLTGEVQGSFDEHDKAKFVGDYCSRHGISLADVVAVGDSRSDLPLFGTVGRAIAFNGTAVARERAHASYEGADLRVLLQELLPGS